MFGRGRFGASFLGEPGSVRAILVLCCLCAASLAQSPSSLAPDAAKGKRIAAAKCVDCHTLARITEAHHTKEEWSHVVATMEGRGAVLEADEISPLLQYLSQLSAKNAGRAAKPEKNRAPGRRSGYHFDRPQKRAATTGTVTADPR